MSRSEASMTAEAIARLRQALEFPLIAGLGTYVRTNDLRALLDAHAALEAAHREVTDLTGDLTPEVLTRLSDVQGYVRCGDRAALRVDYARGVADERARVVADLRKCVVVARRNSEDEYLVRYVRALADRYERGEHEREEGT